MAKIMLTGAGVQTQVDERVEFSFNTNMNDKQKESGIVAKVQVRHPMFKCMVTVFQKDQRMFVSEPQFKNEKGNYFGLVILKREVRDYIIGVLKGTTQVENGAWYLNLINKEPAKPTQAKENEALGLVDIILDTNLTNVQMDKGMLAKATIETTIGTLYGYTIFESAFGESLYDLPPTEGDANNKTPAYTMTENGRAQVLGYVHSLVDWTVKRERTTPVNTAVQNATQSEEEVINVSSEGFMPAEEIDNAVFGG